MISRRHTSNPIFVFLLLIGLSNHAMACMAHYRSTIDLATQCPVIIQGEVESVAIAKHEMKEQALDMSRMHDLNDERHTIATIRVMEVIKGECNLTHIRVNSGALYSCDPRGSYYTYTKGEQSIFMLTEIPQAQSVVPMRWAGSVLPVSERLNLQMSMEHYKVFYDSFIADMQQENPNIGSHARQIQTAITEIHKKFKRESLNKTELEIESIQENLVKEAISYLKTVPLQSIVYIKAIERNTDNKVLMQDNNLADAILDQFNKARADDILEYEKTRLRKLLASKRVEKKYIDSYLSGLKTDDVWLSFPPSPPRAYRKLSPDDFTTDFIVRYYSFDQASMTTAYAYSIKDFANLESERVSSIVKALYGSDNYTLSNIGRWIIGAMPGEVFIRDIMASMSYKDPRNWQDLTHHQYPEENDKKIKAMIDTGHQKEDIYYRQRFWDLLRKGQCYEPYGIEKAINTLETMDPDEMTDDDKAMRETLCSYLESALQHSLSESIIRPAKTYRKLLLQSGKDDID